MAKQYYILSTKWTYPDSFCFTFYGKDNSGYEYDLNRAGLYSGDNIFKRYPLNEGTLPVSKELVDRWSSDADSNGRIMRVLLNKPFIRKSININIFMLDGGMSKIIARYFSDFKFPEGFKHINPEKKKMVWNGYFQMGVTNEVEEPWHYDEQIKAESHNKAKYEMYKRCGDDILESTGILCDYDEYFVRTMALITCRKIKTEEFAGWED